MLPLAPPPVLFSCSLVAIFRRGHSGGAAAPWPPPPSHTWRRPGACQLVRLSAVTPQQSRAAGCLRAATGWRSPARTANAALLLPPAVVCPRLERPAAQYLFIRPPSIAPPGSHTLLRRRHPSASPSAPFRVQWRRPKTPNSRPRPPSKRGEAWGARWCCVRQIGWGAPLSRPLPAGPVQGGPDDALAVPQADQRLGQG